MNLSIIIVSWNVKEKLRECLGSVEETMREGITPHSNVVISTEATTGSAVEKSHTVHNGERMVWQGVGSLDSGRHMSAFARDDEGGGQGGELAYEVFVVDNASKDGSASMVEKEFPWVHLIANDFNAGFAKANNQAIRLSQGRYVLLLNPDMRLLGGGGQAPTLQGMVCFMDEPRNARIGVAGCHLVDEQGHTVPHVRRFPRFVDQLAIMLKVPHLFPRVLDSYMMKDFDYAREARVDSIRGSFFMIRREVLDKIGRLDEGFFIWFEEVDFCKRAIEARYEVAYTPSVKAVDYVGQSFKQIRLYRKQKMMTRSLLYYFKKHHPWWQYRILRVLRPFALAAVWVGDKLNVQGKRVT